MIAEPPLLAGAVNATLALALPAVTVPIVGAPGTVRGVTDAELDAALDPTALFALTVQAYALPFVRPVTTIGLDVPVAVTAALVPVTHDAV